MKTTKIVALAIFGLLLTFSAKPQNNNVGIGTTSPDASAALDIVSTDKGVLVPRVTSSQRQNIKGANNSNPTNGLLVYDLTTASFWFYNNGWTELNSSASASPAIGKARNWMFGNSQGGGSGNVGLEVSLSPINFQGQVTRVNITKFLTVPGESISKLQVVLYSNRSFNLGVTMYQCTFDTLNPAATCNTVLYPRIGDGTINIIGNPVLVGQVVPITGTFSNNYTKVPQVITFTFSPPITPTEDSVELLLESLSTSSGTASIGIYQIVIE